MQNEGNPHSDVMKILLDHIRAKINRITLMVGGKYLRYPGLDWAPVPLLSSFISGVLNQGAILPTAVRGITFLAFRGIPG